MEIIHLNSEDKYKKPVVLACGLFDGMHKGHQKVLETAKERAKELNCDFGVLTFSVSPKNVLNNRLQHIMNLPQKIEEFKKHGANGVFIFDANMSSLNISGKVFCDLLVKNNVIEIVSGVDFRFGSKASNTWEDVEDLTDGKIKATGLKFIEMDNIKISTSHIIEDIKEGNFKIVNEKLGHYYSLTGTVVEGNKLGRTIDFPTANIFIEEGFIIPKLGVYKSAAIVDGVEYKSITNFGKNPTVTDSDTIKCETHIFEFNENIYGKQIKILIKDFIRLEKKFNSLDELKQQISKDIKQANK